MVSSSKTIHPHYDRVILIISITYMLAVSAYMVWHQQFFSPDRFFIFACGGMLLLGRAWTFFWDWLPPILLILGYDYLRGLVPDFISKTHIHIMIYFDKFFFGQVPTLTLQHLFFVDGRIRWYDNLAVIMYFLHFVIPLVVALFFWFIDRKLFKQYMVAMVVLSYLAFFTYIAFPAMPPWMAAQQGFLPPVAHIMDQVLAHFAHPINLPTVYQYVGANLVAAVPSLHAAYPFMTALFFFKKFPKWGWTFFIYPVFMWFAVVYLGEHYVFDITVAVIYCLVIYAGVTNWRGYSLKVWEWTKSLFLKKSLTAIGGTKEQYE
jgi:hypothetical protein